MPAATLLGSVENLGCDRWRIDFILPNLDSEDMYLLLLPSVFGIVGLLDNVFVDADLPKEGIMEVLKLLTLAERAREAFVGVVTALGRPETGRVFAGVV